MIQIQDNISEQKNLKDKLESEQEKLHMEYNKVSCRKWKKQKKQKEIALFPGSIWLMKHAKLIINLKKPLNGKEILVNLMISIYCLRLCIAKCF